MKSKLFKAIFSYLSSVTFSQALTVVYTVGIIWWLNPIDYGLIAANYAIVTMLSFVITLGLHEWLLRTIPGAQKPKVLTGNVIKYKLSVGIVWGLLLWLIMPLVQPSIYQKGLLAIIIVDVWLDSVFNLMLADLLANERVQTTSALLFLSRVLRLLSLGVIIIFRSNSITLVCLFRLLSTLTISVLAFFQAKPVLQKNQITEIANVLRYSLVFNASELFNSVFLQLDLNLITWINGDPEVIGNFAIAINLINMIMTAPLAVVYLVLPSTIDIYKNNIAKFCQRLFNLLVGFLLLGLILWLGIGLLRMAWVQALLGANYLPALSLLFFASPLLLIRTVNQFNRVYLFSIGLEHKQLLPQILSILVKLVLGILLVGKWGVTGLIWLSITADLILLIGYTLPVVKHAKTTLRIML
ncbi:MAG: oligosaccharide flippase family protein [Chloroflexi bacterium]|nr:oligosaccharide flippase family protein [Chloroflexota bacterium]